MTLETEKKPPIDRSFRRSFKSWFLVSCFISGLLVITQSLTKIPERMGQADAHWLLGNQEPWSYVLMRVAIVLIVSTLVAIVAASGRAKTLP